MPFVNDVIATNQEKVAESKQKNCVPRVSRYLFDPDAILQQLRQKIVGQESVLASLGDLLHCVKADITDRSRPLAVCFLVGPTGVGKTETVKLISQAITGQANKLCRIDMNTLAQEHYAASLTGAPPGYTGSKEGHTLFNEELIKGSYSQPGVVLFDEIEKANDVVKP